GSGTERGGGNVVAVGGVNVIALAVAVDRGTVADAATVIGAKAVKPAHLAWKTSCPVWPGGTLATAAPATMPRSWIGWSMPAAVALAPKIWLSTHTVESVAKSIRVVPQLTGRPARCVASTTRAPTTAREVNGLG